MPPLDSLLMHSKDKALKAYKSFGAWVLTQEHRKDIKVLRSDCRSEYPSKRNVRRASGSCESSTKVHKWHCVPKEGPLLAFAL
jgi:hypothetical protein